MYKNHDCKNYVFFGETFFNCITLYIIHIDLIFYEYVHALNMTRKSFRKKTVFSCILLYIYDDFSTDVCKYHIIWCQYKPLISFHSWGLKQCPLFVCKLMLIENCIWCINSLHQFNVHYMLLAKFLKVYKIKFWRHSVIFVYLFIL
jgi:hypothetical protein